MSDLRISPEVANLNGAGDSATFVAKMESGWTVDHWRKLPANYLTTFSIGDKIAGTDNQTNYVYGYTGPGTVFLAVRFRWLNYAVSYNANGGSGVPSPSSVSYTNRFELAASPTTSPAGHHFVSWTNCAVSAESYAAGESVSGAVFSALANVHVDNPMPTIALAAQWAPNVTNVNLVSAGATNGTVEATYGQLLPKVTSPERAGWTFGGYFTGENGSGTQYYDADGICTKAWTETTVDELHAKWTQMFTVTFYEDDRFGGGVLKTESVPLGGNATAPSKPKHDGYIFNAWKGSYVSVTDNEDVYATYDARTYSIIFHANGGKGTMPNQNCDYGTPTKLAANKYSRTGYSFVGWSDSPDSTEIVREDGEDGVMVALGGENLYAVWVPIGYSLSFAAGGGVGTMDPVPLSYDQSCALPECTFTPPTGCAFRDWSLTVAGVVTNLPAGAVVSNLTTEAGATVTATATWRGFYTIAFDGNGSGGGTMTNCVVENDVAFQLPSNEYVRANFHFGGWATSAAEAARYADGAVVTNLTAAGKTCTLFAVWQTNRCTVVFSPNPPPGVSVTGTMDNQELVYGQGQKLTKCAYSCGELWSFTGWSNTVNGATYVDEQAPDDIFGEDGATVELKAKWLSALGELSEAMGCNNLIWTTGSKFSSKGLWEVGSWPETVDACAMNKENAGDAWMWATVRTNGVLRFEWTVENGGKNGILLCNEKGDILDSLTLEDSSAPAEFVVDLKGKALATINIVHTETNKTWCFVRNMTWTPEGAYPVPGPGDAATISSASVVDGKFVLSFAATNVFDYVLRTNADLRVDSWGEMMKTNGAETVTFEPPILLGLPQLFYKVETVQKK